MLLHHQGVQYGNEGPWRALTMGHVGDALIYPHDGLHDDEVHMYSPCACGAFLSLVEHYGWCSSCILHRHGEDAFDDVLYPLDVVDDHERMFVVEDSWCLAPHVEDDVGSPHFLEEVVLGALEVMYGHARVLV